MNDSIARFIANKLPWRVVYWGVVRAWVYSTTGEYSHRDATKVTAGQITAGLVKDHDLWK